MRAVVFGGSGFLGSHVVDSLLEKGFDVAIFDKNQSMYADSNVRMFVGDIQDEQAVENAVEGSDYVYNFAGIADLDNASTRPTDTIKLNVLGNCNILSACVKYKVKRFVYASTFYVHSDKGGFYRCSKQAAELYIEEYYQKYGLEYTILRYGSLYGVRADKTNGVYRLIYSAIKEGIIRYPGTGEEMREYIHVKDAAILSVKVLGEEFVNKHIILTGSIPYKSAIMVQMIQEIIGKPLEIEFTGGSSGIHYNVTPYIFKPKYSYKLTSTFYRDIGQGIVECIEEINAEITRGVHINHHNQDES